MYVPIANMPPASRVWVYQSDRELASPEIQVISENMQSFCVQWTAHGADLQTSFDMQHNRFVILAVNEQMASASGCSIDGSTHVLKNLGQQLSVDFFNRSQVAFLENGAIVTFSINDLKMLFAEGKLNENSISFNTLVATLGQWRDQGQVKVQDCWLKRFLPKITV